MSISLPYLFKKDKKYYRHNKKSNKNQSVITDNRKSLIDGRYNSSSGILCCQKNHQYSLCHLNNKPQLYLRNNHKFFSSANLYHLQIKDMKKQLTKYINSFAIPKVSNNVYEEFTQLITKSNQSFMNQLNKNQKKSKDPNNAQINLNKQIFLCTFLDHYKSISKNPSQILKRILLALDINPMNDFDLINWDIYSKLQKIFTLDMNNVEQNQFICNFIFSKNTNKISHEEFVRIFRCVIAKILQIVDNVCTKQLIQRIINFLSTQYLKDMEIIKQNIKNKIAQEPFIWKEFYKLLILTQRKK